MPTATTPKQPRTLRPVEKASYDRQSRIPVPAAAVAPLAPGHVRVQPLMLGLAGYNLSYCAMGDLSHWYDAYPLSVFGKVLGGTEFDDQGRYAVPVGWGYMEVVESRVEGLEVGRRMYGMLPMGDVSVDLKLMLSREGEDALYWVEVSEHRAEMMALYKLYIVVEGDFGEDVPRHFREWRCGAFTVWQCGYLLNRYCFGAWKDE